MQDADARFPRPRTVTGSPGNRSQALQTTEIRAVPVVGTTQQGEHHSALTDLHRATQRIHGDTQRMTSSQ